jgi:hypothetical protein
MPWIENVAAADIPIGFHHACGPNAMLIQIMDTATSWWPEPKHEFKERHQFEFLDIEKNDHCIDPVMKISDEQAKKLVDLGAEPGDLTDHLSPEDRTQIAQSVFKKEPMEAYSIMVSGRKDWKMLPAKAFRAFYKNITEDSPYQEKGVAQNAIHDEAIARKHQLVHVTIGPNAKLEDLERYKRSHDPEVSQAARVGLAKIKNLNKSDNLASMIKRIKEKLS